MDIESFTTPTLRNARGSSRFGPRRPAEQSAAVDLIVGKLEPELDRDYQARSLALILDELVWAEDVRTGAMRKKTWSSNVSTFLRSHQSSSLPPMQEWTDFGVVDAAWGKVAEE